MRIPVDLALVSVVGEVEAPGRGDLLGVAPAEDRVWEGQHLVPSALVEKANLPLGSG